MPSRNDSAHSPPAPSSSGPRTLVEVQDFDASVDPSTRASRLADNRQFLTEDYNPENQMPNNEGRLDDCNFFGAGELATPYHLPYRPSLRRSSSMSYMEPEDLGDKDEQGAYAARSARLIQVRELSAWERSVEALRRKTHSGVEASREQIHVEVVKTEEQARLKRVN